MDLVVLSALEGRERCRWGITPRGSGWRWGECARDMAQQVGLGTGGGEGETNTGSGLVDASPKLEQAQPDRRELGLGQAMGSRDGVVRNPVSGTQVRY